MSDGFSSDGVFPPFHLPSHCSQCHCSQCHSADWRRPARTSAELARIVLEGLEIYQADNRKREAALVAMCASHHHRSRPLGRGGGH